MKIYLSLTARMLASIFLLSSMVQCGDNDDKSIGNNVEKNRLMSVCGHINSARGIEYINVCTSFTESFQKITQTVLPPPLDPECRVLKMEFENGWQNVLLANPDPDNIKLGEVANLVFKTICYGYRNLHLPTPEAWKDDESNYLLRIDGGVVATPDRVKRGIDKMLQDFREIAGININGE